MKLKLVGFKIGKGRPTANITFDFNKLKNATAAYQMILLGKKLYQILKKSDFVSVRKVK